MDVLAAVQQMQSEIEKYEREVSSRAMQNELYPVIKAMASAIREISKTVK